MKRKTLRLIAFAWCSWLPPLLDTAAGQRLCGHTDRNRRASKPSATRSGHSVRKKQAIVEQLEADKASVVEQKQAMDERNMAYAPANPAQQ